MALTLALPDMAERVGHYLLMMVRTGALLSLAPLFGEKAVSVRVRVGLAAVVALLLGGSIPTEPLDLGSPQGIWAIAREVLIGAALGLVMQLLFAAVRLAGEVMGMQMGLSFATFFDPGAGSVPVVARLLNLLVMLLFLAFDGHLWLINLLAHSFTQLPPGAAPLSAQGFRALVSMAGLVFQEGLRLGLPVIALLLCINLTLGVLNRLTPQLSVFVIGFPLTLSAGIIALSLLSPTLREVTERLMATFFQLDFLLPAQWNAIRQ